MGHCPVRRNRGSIGNRSSIFDQDNSETAPSFDSKVVLRSLAAHATPHSEFAAQRQPILLSLPLGVRARRNRIARSTLGRRSARLCRIWLCRPRRLCSRAASAEQLRHARHVQTVRACCEPTRQAHCDGGRTGRRRCWICGSDERRAVRLFSAKHSASRAARYG